MTPDETRSGNEKVMRELLRLLGIQEFSAGCALLTEDAVNDFPYPPVEGWPSEICGRENIEKLISGSKENGFTPYHYEVTAVFDLVDPNRLIAEYRSNATFTPSNIPYRNNYIGIFEFRDGLVSYWREYLNPQVIANVVATVAEGVPD
jgi:ketosteroid isomerase-like protein